MQIPFKPLEAGGYREIYRLSCTVTAFFEAHQHWPDTLVTSRHDLLELFKKIPKDWQEPLLKRLRFEIAPEDNTLIVIDGEGRTMDYSTAAPHQEAQPGCDWLFSKPVQVTF
jgi:hypothetical protein